MSLDYESFHHSHLFSISKVWKFIFEFELIDYQLLILFIIAHECRLKVLWLVFVFNFLQYYFPASSLCWQFVQTKLKMRNSERMESLIIMLIQHHACHYTSQGRILFILSYTFQCKNTIDSLAFRLYRRGSKGSGSRIRILLLIFLFFNLLKDVEHIRAKEPTSKSDVVESQSQN